MTPRVEGALAGGGLGFGTAVVQAMQSAAELANQAAVAEAGQESFSALVDAMARCCGG